MGSTVEIKYLCTPHDGKPGESWEKFEGELLDVAAGKTDDRPRLVARRYPHSSR